MSHEATEKVGTAPAVASGHRSIRPDWRPVADDRLARLVELEHDYSIMRGRLERLQVEHRLLLAADENRMRRIHELEKWRDAMIMEQIGMRAALLELTRQKSDLEASFLHSRSWRMTRPLRVFSSRLRGAKHLVARILRRSLRVGIVRRLAAVAARRMPILGQRIRSRLYPGGRTPG